MLVLIVLGMFVVAMLASRSGRAGHRTWSTATSSTTRRPAPGDEGLTAQRTG